MPPRVTVRRSIRAQRAAAITLLAVLGPVGFAAGQEPCPCPPAEPAPEPLWQTKIALAYVATSGNTETETIGLDLDVRRLPQPWGFDLFARYHRTEDAGAETGNRTLAGARAKRALSERWELFAEASGERDEFAGFEQRLIAAVGGTFHAVTGKRHHLDLDAGLSWTDEDRLPPGGDVSYLGALLGASYELVLSERSALRQRLVAYPNFDDSGDWRLESLTTLEAALTERLALRFGFEVRYAHLPINDLDDTDSTTRLALVVYY